MSWRLPPVSAAARGMPPASVMTWCFEPGLRCSAGIGAFWAAFESPDVEAVDHRPGHVELSAGAELAEQDLGRYSHGIAV
jgi:hypothetical protein